MICEKEGKWENNDTQVSLMGTNIVVDVNSGAVHVVDDISYDILDYYQKFTPKK